MLGVKTEAQRVQKQEELKLGVPSIDAKALREQRRAGQGSVLLGDSNRGVADRSERDNAAIVVRGDMILLFNF